MSATQTERLNFSTVKNKPEYPDFLDIQIKSFQDFFQLETKSEERENEGLYKTFLENFPNYRYPKSICIRVFRLFC